VARADQLTGAERKRRECYWQNRAKVDVMMSAEEEDERVALDLLLRSWQLKEQCCRMDGLGLQFRFTLRMLMAKWFLEGRAEKNG